jgi:hypothetical protein
MSGLPPRPANTVFGLEVDGVRQSIGFKSIAEAEQAAPLAEGRKVVIFDRVTGEIVKRLAYCKEATSSAAS